REGAYATRHILPLLRRSVVEARCCYDTQPFAVRLLELLASGVLLVGFCTSAATTQTAKRSLKPPGARRAAALSLRRPTHPNNSQREIE
ncbi:unnamed protein product, partial [Ectocarpus sp. 12 AP-2014]